MNDLSEAGAIRELRELRAEVTGRAPEELHKARGMLLAEVHAVGEAGAEHRRRRLPRPRPRLRLRGTSWPHAARWLRPVLFGGVAAAAAAALTVSLLPGSTARQPRPAQRTSAPATLTAAFVLNRAAAAAAAASRPVPRPGQFIYVSSVTTYLSTEVEVGNAGVKYWLYKTSRQIWQSVTGQRAGILQIVQLGNEKLPWGPTPPAISGNPVSWTSLPATICPGAAPSWNTYAFLASLPTDPARLRTWIYQHPGGQNSPDEQAWTDIGDMLREMLVPPKLAAALFRVAAAIPGATAVSHATNAVGQGGVAASRSGTELIFDPRTYQLIGEGAVLNRPVAGLGPAGTVTAATAQLQEKVVDSLPDVPPSQVSTSAGGVSC
jgi:hypothetical protein